MQDREHYEIIVPDVGKYDKLELLQWFFSEGEIFSEGDEICELETDKAVFPIEANCSGKLTKIVIQAPVEVKTKQLLGTYQILEKE